MTTYETNSIAAILLVPAIIVLLVMGVISFGNTRAAKLEEAMQTYEDCLRDRTGMGIYEWRATGRELPKLDNC